VNVFLSWSGVTSQQVAVAFRKWLPYMLHSVKPFMSTVDIRMGDNWNADLSHELNGAQHGIVCVTQFNVHKPWMNFESGALSHLLQLTPFLFRVEPSALGHSPLGQFQLTPFGPDDQRNRSECYKLIESINRIVAEDAQLAPDVLLNNFNHWWPQLGRDLDNIPTTSVGETRTAYKWLLTFEDLAIYDLNARHEVVWVVTSDVFKYALRAGVKSRIEASLKQVQYRYLIPEPFDDNQRAAKDQLEQLAQRYPDRVACACFKRDVFEKQAASDYIVVKSCLAETSAIRVFVRIPVADTETDYWFDTDERAAIAFYGRFLQLWNSSTDRAC
jgi:hypothetical protein